MFKRLFSFLSSHHVSGWTYGMQVCAAGWRETSPSRPQECHDDIMKASKNKPEESAKSSDHTLKTQRIRLFTPQIPKAMVCHKWCLRKRRTHKGFKFKYSCQLERWNWKKNTVSFRNSDMVIHLSLSTTFRAMNNFQTHSFELFAARSSVSLYSTCCLTTAMAFSSPHSPLDYIWLPVTFL